MQTEIRNEIKRASGWLIGLGVMMMALGVAAIVEPLIASVLVARALSWTLLIAGVLRVVHAVQSRRQQGFWLKFLIGMLYLIAASLLLSNLLGAKLTLTLALGWVILAQGVLEVVTALRIRPEVGWGVMLTSGLIAIVIGILILYRWPINAVWLLGLFTGISFFCTGIWMISLPWSIRNYFGGSDGG